VEAAQRVERLEQAEQVAEVLEQTTILQQLLARPTQEAVAAAVERLEQEHLVALVVQG
jgi:hypothetical protein